MNLESQHSRQVQEGPDVLLETASRLLMEGIDSEGLVFDRLGHSFDALCAEHFLKALNLEPDDFLGQLKGLMASDPDLGFGLAMVEDNEVNSQLIGYSFARIGRIPSRGMREVRQGMILLLGRLCTERKRELERTRADRTDRFRVNKEAAVVREADASRDVQETTRWRLADVVASDDNSAPVFFGTSTSERRATAGTAKGETRRVPRTGHWQRPHVEVPSENGGPLQQLQDRAKAIRSAEQVQPTGSGRITREGWVVAQAGKVAREKPLNIARDGGNLNARAG